MSNDILERYQGTYTPSEHDNGFDVIKEDNSLKVIVGANLLSYLYPIGENRFFALANGAGIQIEFIKDDLNKIIKAKIYGDGKLLIEVKKIK